MTDKVAIYTRVSTVMQVNDGDSLEMQRERLIGYCKNVLLIDDYEVFEDPGYSGKNTDRPAFQQMMTRLRSGEFSHLLVWKIDRISRNVLDFAQMYSELKSLGVIFISSLERFDTGTAMGEAMLKIILVFAELERNMTAERVQAVMLSRATKGQWNGGRIPFGYDYDPETGTFSINSKEAETYYLILDTYEKTESITKTVNHINNLGIKTRQGNDWSATTIHKILTNQFYVGDYVYNVRDEHSDWRRKDPSEWIITSLHHPALISPERRNRLTYKLENNRRNSRKKGDTYRRKHVHIFAGLIECGICGSNYISARIRVLSDGLQPSLYNCSARRANKNACSNKAVMDTTIGPFIFRFIANMLYAQKTVKKRTSRAAVYAMLTNGLDCTIPDEDVETITISLRSNMQVTTLSPEVILETKESTAISEEITLTEKQKRNELALTRLRNLYLYSEDETAPAEFIAERQKILDDQKAIEKRLSEIINTEDADKDAYLEQKASWLAMLKVLEQPDKFDYREFIKAVDNNVPKAFLNSVISRVIVLDGQVTKITFKNGLFARFSYTSEIKPKNE